MKQITTSIFVIFLCQNLFGQFWIPKERFGKGQYWETDAYNFQNYPYTIFNHASNLSIAKQKENLIELIKTDKDKIPVGEFYRIYKALWDFAWESRPAVGGNPSAAPSRLPMWAKAQSFIDTLYNSQKGAKTFTHIYSDNVSDTVIVLCTSANKNVSDSNWYEHVILYKICLKNSYLKEISRKHKNYWTIYSNYWVQFEPEANRFMYATEDTATREFSKYQQQYYVMVTTSDNWLSNTETKLNLPFRSYFLMSCLKTSSGYIISGDTGTFVYSPAFVASYDFDFNLNWLKVYPFQCRFTSILKSKKGYFLSGVKGFNSEQKIYNAAIDSVGNITWEKDYLDTSYFMSGFPGQGVKIGNKYFSYGFTTNDTSFKQIGYLNALDENGNLIFEKFYPLYNNFSFRKMVEYNNSLYAIAHIDSLVHPDTLGRLVHFSKISSETGKMEWYQIYKHWYGYNEIHNFYKVNDGFLMCGSSVNQNRFNEFDSTGIIEGDAWFLKVDTNGCIIPGCKPNVYGGIQHVLHDNSLIEVYPNPAKESFTINFKGKFLQNTSNEIFIFDAAGKQLYQQELIANQTTVIIENSFNYCGFAFLVIKNSGGIFYKKIILQ